jgi:hypothetical protein
MNNNNKELNKDIFPEDTYKLFKISNKKKVYMLPYSQSYLGGYTACTTISIYICLYNIYNKNNDPEISDMENIMIKAINSWKKWHRDDFEYCNQVYNRSKFLKNKLKIQAELTGIMTENDEYVEKYKESGILDLENLIYKFYYIVDELELKDNKLCAGVLTFDVYSISIFIKGEKSWIFDSHNRDEMGFFINDKSKYKGAVLVNLKDQFSLQEYLINLFGEFDPLKDNISNNYFVLTIFTSV